MAEEKEGFGLSQGENKAFDSGWLWIILMLLLMGKNDNSKEESTEEIENGKKIGFDVKKGVKDFLEEQFKGYANAMPKTVVAEENAKTTKIPVISMDDVPKIAKEMEKTKKVMISQPMRGKTREEILEERNKAKEMLETLGCEVADSFFTEEWLEENAKDKKNVPLWCLGESLKIMSECDGVYFCDGWGKARGCRIERACAVSYGLHVIDIKADVERMLDSVKKEVLFAFTDDLMGE